MSLSFFTTPSMIQWLQGKNLNEHKNKNDLSW